MASWAIRRAHDTGVRICSPPFLHFTLAQRAPPTRGAGKDAEAARAEAKAAEAARNGFERAVSYICHEVTGASRWFVAAAIRSCACLRVCSYEYVHACLRVCLDV
jgi:hypothetical protein